MLTALLKVYCHTLITLAHKGTYLARKLCIENSNYLDGTELKEKNLDQNMI